MGPGIFMAVVGAILLFAVRVNVQTVNLQVVGLIFLIAGGALIALDVRSGRRKRVSTDVVEHERSSEPGHSVRDVVRRVRRD